MYERFTDRARKVMQLAAEEARGFNHEYIGTEHILLGLIKERSGAAAHVLKNLGADLRRIRLEVEKIVQPGPDMVTTGKLPQTPRAKKVIEYSIEEARNHDHVGTEHLLLGLIREEGGVAAAVLTNFGLNTDRLRQEVLNVLGYNVPSPANENDTASREKLQAAHRVVEELNQSDGVEPPESKPRNPAPPSVRAPIGIESRIRLLERQLTAVRFLFAMLFAASTSQLIGGYLGAVIGVLVAIAAHFGRLIPALLAGGIAGGCVASAQFGDETGTVAGAVVGALLAVCVAEIGRPHRTDPTPPK